MEETSEHYHPDCNLCLDEPDDDLFGSDGPEPTQGTAIFKWPMYIVSSLLFVARCICACLMFPLTSDEPSMPDLSDEMHSCRNPTLTSLGDEDDDYLELGALDGDRQPPVPEQLGLKEAKPWTVDSGAAESVSDPKDVPEGMLEESAGSRAGRGYLGAGPNQRIPNLGQIRARRVTETGLKTTMLFQAAEVRKPLVAVSATVDKQNMVVFDHEKFGGGCIIPNDAPELDMIRQLVQQVTNRIRLQRQNGVYLMRNWVADAPFAGPGA